MRTATITSVEPYELGMNDRLDRINTGKIVWIVQGSKGRRPIIAGTEDEARNKYISKKAVIIEDDTEDVL